MNNFDNLSALELFGLLETDNSNFRFNRHDTFIKILKKLEESKDKEKLEEMKKELLIHDLHMELNNRIIRFHPMMSGTTEDGKTWEYPNLKTDFSEEAIKYYKRRIKTTKNSIFLARYCDFLWFYKKDFEYAKKAVEAYLKCGDIYLLNHWGIELADSLLRALEISRSIKNEELKKRSISKMLDVINELRKDKDYRFLLEIIWGLTKIPDYIDLTSLVSIIEEAITYFQDNKDDSYNLQRDFLSLLVEIHKKDTTKKKEIELRIVTNLIQEAEWKKTHYPNGNLIASSIYQQALKMYQDGGYSKEAEEIKVILQELNKFTQDSFKAIKSEVSIPNSVIDDYLSKFKGKSTKQIIELISVDKGLIPDYKKSQESAIEQAKGSILQLFPISLFRGNLQIKTIIEEKDKLEFNSIKNFHITYKITAGLLLPKIFDFIEKDNPDYIKDLIEFVSECSFIDKKRIPLISLGLSFFKDKNYVASIHILIFQIEGILRDMLESMKMSTFTFRNNEMMARLFSGIIERLYLIEGLDENLIKLIDIFLNNPEGDNLRNDIAHSLSSIEEFGKENNLLLILIILNICSYKIIKK